MKKRNYIKTTLPILFVFGLLAGFLSGSSAVAETTSNSQNSEAVRPEASATPNSETKDDSAEDNRYFEAYEVEDSLGKRSLTRRKRPEDWRKARACTNIFSSVKAAVGGNAARANCYMGLFFMETTCAPDTRQRAGNTGNAHAAYGVCSLEASPSVRRSNGRGPDCVNIDGITNQTKCCRAIMRRSPRYFGPYRRGEVGQCG